MKTEKDIAKIFSEIELNLIDEIKRHLKTHTKDVLIENLDWKTFQTQQLHQLILFTKEYKDKYPNLYKKINQEIVEILKDSYNLGLEEQQKIILKAILKDTHVNPSESLLSKLKNIEGNTLKDKSRIILKNNYNLFSINERALNSLIKDMTSGILEVESTILKKLDEEYRNIIFKSQLYSQSGTKSLYESIDVASKNFLENGINNVIYKNGNHVNIQSYIEMAVRTGRKQAYFYGEAQMRDEWGINKVQVSQYGACSQTCLPWQGRIYIDDVYSTLKPTILTPYQFLSEAISAGLFHPNCRHTMSTFFEGINEEYIPMNTSQIYENNLLEEKQRYIERNIRKYKRLEIGSLDFKNIEKYKNLREKWENELNKLLKDNSNLRRDEWREGNQEIDRLLSSSL